MNTNIIITLHFIIKSKDTSRLVRFLLKRSPHNLAKRVDQVSSIYRAPIKYEKTDETYIA